MMTYDERYTTREWRQHAEASIKLSQERRARRRWRIVLSPLQKGVLTLLGLVAWLATMWYGLLWLATTLFT